MTQATPDNAPLSKAQADHSAQIDAAKQMMWLDEAAKGLAQVANGHTSDARQSLAEMQKRRTDEWNAFEQSCLTSAGRLNGWKFNREAANQR